MSVATTPTQEWPKWTTPLGIAAVLFGLMTLASGGLVLFGGYHTAMGNIVPFVLWFNFLSGFFYAAAGVGIILRANWSLPLSLLIAGMIVGVFAVLLYAVLTGSAYETRTILAMTSRAIFWLSTAFLVARAFRQAKADFPL